MLAIQAIKDFGIQRLALVLCDSACIDKLSQSTDFPRFATNGIQKIVCAGLLEKHSFKIHLS